MIEVYTFDSDEFGRRGTFRRMDIADPIKVGVTRVHGIGLIGLHD